MQGQVDKTIWRRIGLIAILLPICFFFPLALFLVGLLAWSIYEDMKPPKYPDLPAARTWRDAKPEDDDWLTLFCEGCESPAEEQFLRAMVKEFDLKPDNGVLKSPKLTLAMQVEVANYRYDFLANGRQVIEVDGAGYHSSTEQVERDRIRDEYSVQGGYKVLRIPAIVVFKTPDEAIRRVKAALAETPTFTQPQRMKPAIQKKTIAQHFDAFVDGLDKLNQHVEIAVQTKRATEGFLSAISSEQLFLKAMVAEAELDRRVEEMSPQPRKHYDALKRDLFLNEEPRPLIYEWKKIAMPSLVEDRDIQWKIDAEYATAMNERNQRLAELKERCVKDPRLTRLLCRKLVDAGFPADEAIKIVPPSAFFEALLAPK
ncbi:endonuclease domain-containing protein [Mesorhizobium muleiense]|uniref:endonuclease domain-containing protein n=1 Tax=Mesorhizobium muleiense TaxID=1004279 RepID=UPI001F2576C9|nr:DUF559 domain-containing protein [Mesorhizobium muleiense]MCF6110812.1 DUF559 domain-containing protein [Mesorhizobium muleiense]